VKPHAWQRNGPAAFLRASSRCATPHRGQWAKKLSGVSTAQLYPWRA
jgi:hypothetical protein